MNNLAINIEYLLLSHNSVIVPSLGAFYAQHTPARSVQGEEVFLPPVRHIHFDATLNVDPDDIFIHSFAQLYQCTLMAARKRCQEMVSDFHRRLISDGTLDFGSIGVFTLEEDAEITLAPCECGVITPAYYGLDTLHFQALNAEDYTPHSPMATPHVSAPHMVTISHAPMATTHVPATTGHPVTTGHPHTPGHPHTTSHPHTPVSCDASQDHPTPHQSDDTHYTIRISKSTVNYAMAIAATIALFFIMRPTTVSTMQPTQQARPIMFLQPEMVQQPLQQANIQEDTLTTPLLLSDADDTLLPSDTDTPHTADTSFDGVLIDVTEDTPTPTSNTPKPASNTPKPASNTPKPALSCDASQDPATKPAAKPAALPATKPATTTPSRPSSPALSCDASQDSRYCIVMASGVAKANAEIYVSKLAKEGIRATIIEGELRRVVIDGFTTYDSARQRMNAIKAAGHCPDAWILKL